MTRDFDAATITRYLTEDFTAGAFDLSLRAEAPSASWDSMPEFVAERALRELGASSTDVRLFITLVAAMDRARDADRLWRNAVNLFQSERWAFSPAEGPQHGHAALGEALMRTGVSQRHGPDSAAWYRILHSLADDESPSAVRDVVFDGRGDVLELRRAVRRVGKSGVHWYPLLRGPKISEMWIRMLAAPGQAAQITNIDKLSVAVDTQVRKVSRYLGIVDTGGGDIDDYMRQTVQHAWAIRAQDVVAPPPLARTCAGLDPALWFFGKWGCTFCERAGHKKPISRACGACTLASR